MECPNCSTYVFPDAKHCDRCGYDLATKHTEAAVERTSAPVTSASLYGSGALGVAVLAGAAAYLTDIRALWHTFAASLFVALLAFLKYSVKTPKTISPASLGKLTQRPFVLLLRAFAVDQDRVYCDPYGVPFEEHIVRACSHVGPTVAVGRPGEPSAPKGAARVYFDEHDWKEGVRALMQKAVLVLFVINDTDGLKWELEEMDRLARREGVVFFVPPGLQYARRTPARARVMQSLPALLESRGDRDFFLRLDRAGSPMWMQSPGSSFGDAPGRGALSSRGIRRVLEPVLASALRGQRR